MFSVIKWEIKKSFKPGVFILWALGLFLAYSSIRTTFSLNDVYADVFSKYYGLAPIMGLAMFSMFAGSFVLEYNSNMDGLIKASKNGKKQLVLGKFIANGISASIINLSILFVMLGKVVSKFKFEGLDWQLKSLWYFEKSNSSITVLQMILILMLTVIVGSFIFSGLGLFLSSISKGAAIPFIFGGLLMGSPYLLENWISNTKIFTNTPLWGMYSVQLIRYKSSISAWIIFGIIAVLGLVLFYNLAKKSFLKER